MQIAYQVGQEMRVDHPLCYILLVHRPDHPRQLQLGIHLIDHGLQGLVGAVLRPGSDVSSGMAEVESLVLGVGAQPFRDQIEPPLQVLGAGVGEGGLKKLQGIDRSQIQVVSLLVHLRRIENGGHDQAGVHLPTPFRGKIGHGEVDQGIHEQHDAVLIPIAVPPLGRMEEGMAKPSRGRAVAYQPAENSCRGMGGQAHHQLSDQILGCLGIIEWLQMIEPGQQLVHKPGYLQEVLARIPG